MRITLPWAILGATIFARRCAPRRVYAMPGPIAFPVTQRQSLTKIKSGLMLLSSSRLRTYCMKFMRPRASAYQSFKFKKDIFSLSLYYSIVCSSFRSFSVIFSLFFFILIDRRFCHSSWLKLMTPTSAYCDQLFFRIFPHSTNSSPTMRAREEMLSLILFLREFIFITIDVS